MKPTQLAMNGEQEACELLFGLESPMDGWPGHRWMLGKDASRGWSLDVGHGREEFGTVKRIEREMVRWRGEQMRERDEDDIRRSTERKIIESKKPSHSSNYHVDIR